jgi:hypothetical protein
MPARYVGGVGAQGVAYAGDISPWVVEDERHVRSHREGRLERVYGRKGDSFLPENIYNAFH